VTANLFDGPPDFEHDGATMRGVAKAAGAELLGATAYELAPGARWADLHYHHANEELLLVLEGTPTLHTLEGSRELAPGDVVAFLRGRRGAHRLSNESGTPTRFVLVSTMAMPEVVEYPESERVFVMSEPPWSDAPYDETRGRVIRGFAKQDGRPVPPDSDD
jgi:uncharacterized cupin superfamily protein